MDRAGAVRLLGPDPAGDDETDGCVEDEMTAPTAGTFEQTTVRGPGANRG